MVQRVLAFHERMILVSASIAFGNDVPSNDEIVIYYEFGTMINVNEEFTEVFAIEDE